MGCKSVCASKPLSFGSQAEHETAQSELFELRSGREALHSTQAHEAEHIAQEHEQALAEIR